MINFPRWGAATGRVPSVFLSAILAVSLALGSCSKKDERPDVYTTVTAVNKLVLAQMSISKMSVTADLPMGSAKGLKQTTAALIDKLKIGDRKAAYSFDTYLQAYVDLSLLRPEDVVVDPRTFTVTITLPPIFTEFVGRDAEIREDHYRVTGMRSQVSAQERAEIKARMSEILREEVETNPRFSEAIMSVARQKGVEYFRSLLSAEGYKVNVKFRNSAGNEAIINP